MSGDRLRASVHALAGQLLAQPHDLVLHLQIDRPRIAVRPPRSGFERGRALPLVTAHQLLHPNPGNSIVPGHLTLRTALHSDGSDHEPGHRHGAPPSQGRC
jgi:hypothetical protein